jgi:hypothetical protein
MATPLSLPTICHLCNKPVTLELARADEKAGPFTKDASFSKLAR